MRLFYSLSLFLFTVPAALAQNVTDTASSQGRAQMALFPATDVQWRDGPASLAKGAKMAVLQGGPARPGAFTMRLRFPDGFQVFPHWHMQVEHVTVIAGALNLGMGSGLSGPALGSCPPARLAIGPRG